MRDWERTIISQYASSPTLCQLIENLNEYFDPHADLQRFFDLIWNVDTAEGYGLDVWGRIVGINRVLQVPTSDYLGFAEGGTDGYAPFDQAPFYNGVLAVEGMVLDDDNYRRLILAKAAANVTDGSIPSLNHILMNLFPGRGRAYVTDTHDAVETEYFSFAESRMSERRVELSSDADAILLSDGDAPLGTNDGQFTEASYAWGFDQRPFGDFAPARPTNMRTVYTFEFQLEPFELAMVTRSGVLPRPTGVLAATSYYF